MNPFPFPAVFTIARLTFREAARRWVLWAALLLGLLFLLVYAIGFHEIQKDFNRPYGGMPLVAMAEIKNFMIMAGLYVVNFLTIIMTVLTSVDTLSGEIASGTIHTLVSKPLCRWEIVLGKWLGFTIMLTLYLLLMAGGVLLLGYLIAGYTPPNMLRGILLMWLNVVVLLGVSLAGGAVFSTIANGVLVFGLYGVAFIGGWIEQFGSFMHNQAAVNVGIVCSLLIPSEALWRRAAYEMQSPIVGALGYSPFSSTSVPSPAMIIYAALYALVAISLAVRLFHRRDL
ncbi:MAG: ABC transporter permease [Anaerolineales bacterium]|nr:ABC transporter permease [Anaerolineales bacterium]